MKKKYTFGEIVTLAPDCLLIVGRETNPLSKVSSCSVLLYKHKNTLYIVDTGATAFIKDKIFIASNLLRPFNQIVLYSTQAHADHIANNSILEIIEAPKKTYVLSSYELSQLKTPERRLSQDIRDASFFIDMEELPNTLIRTFFENIDPFEPLHDKAEALDETKKQRFTLGSVHLTGWKSKSSPFIIIESAGYTKGSLMFYIEPLKLLFTGDETASFFPIWQSSNSHSTIALFHSIQKLIEERFIDILIGSHNEQIYKNSAQALDFIEERIALYARFDEYIRKNLIGHKSQGGASIEQLYLSLVASPFSTHLPSWELYSKMLILNKLRSLGCHYDPTDGVSARFLLPKD
jgi:glyoxylase-like metal-dependent hydrolase (beta-lactamase superfamily II)